MSAPASTPTPASTPMSAPTSAPASAPSPVPAAGSARVAPAPVPDQGPVPSPSAPSRSAGVRGLAALRIELAKLRHKHLVPIALAILAVQLVWLGATASRSVQSNPGVEAIALFYQMPLLNAIFLPLLSTIIASTVCDIENRGAMLKELLTMQRARGLFAAKWAVIAMVLGVVIAAQTIVLLVMAGGLGFAGTVPGGTVAAYWISTLAVSVFIATLAEVLSLFCANQFLPLVVGVGLSFLGLFAMYLPEAASYVVPSAYYGLLSTVAMSYDEVAGVASYGVVPWPVEIFALVVVATAVLYLLASRAFTRREL